jgi:hypothetical protein
VEIEAGYETAPEGPATRVDAWVSVLVSRVLAGAADGLLAAGALDGALGGIA